MNSVCPVTAKEAVHELSACPVMAADAAVNLSVLSFPVQPYPPWWSPASLALRWWIQSGPYTFRHSHNFYYFSC